MGKHNGKARASGGPAVGSAFINRSKRKGGGNANPEARFLYTSDAGLQSNLEASDLADLMDMAQLASRDFAAERGVAVVVSNTAVTPMDRERSLLQRTEAEARNAHRLKIPRRPHWTPQMSADEVDAHERSAFVAWRRNLARLEEGEGLVLTPFEKNLEVWRQLWRVLERSHIVVQVVDARDPLMYRSEDMEAFARELHPAKASLLLLNKADLLTAKQRAAWAEHFDAQGLSYVFWSAKAAAEGGSGKTPEGKIEIVAGHGGGRTDVLSCDQLLAVFEQKAAEARKAGSTAPHYGVSPESPEGRLMVGLTGYPNVGKSSTINALFGSKKTTVSATPGKTKHFQTLNVTPRLTLVDCPGLVLPRYAASKAEMVAAGVIPIDRLTNVRAPVAVAAERIPRRQLEEAYSMRLPSPAAHEPPDRPPTAAELLRAVALSRGWAAANGLPDESRAGRLLLKDFTAGKLLHARWPPGHPLAQDQPRTGLGEAARSVQTADVASSEGASSESGSDSEASRRVTEAADQPPPTKLPGDLGDADLDLLQTLKERGLGAKPRRPEYKFQKKAARRKGSRGRAQDGVEYDGAAMRVGKHGGLVRVS